MFATLELAPLALGKRARLRRLSPVERVEALDRLEHTGAAGIVKAARGIAYLSYYGDDAVMRQLGYDADAVVARAAEVRACR